MGILKVTPKELSSTTCIGKTKIYALIKDGHLSPTVRWCGTRKVVFDLHIALSEIAKINQLQPPNDESIGLIWSKIVENRNPINRK